MSYIIDDRDSIVSYTGSWAANGTSYEHDGTISGSLHVGDRFSVPFTGTGIAVYGTLGGGSFGVETSYAIDGSAHNVTTSGAASSSFGADSYQQLFWQADALSNRSHTLVVTMLYTNDGVGGTIWFDYFNVTGASAMSPSSSGLSPSTVPSSVASPSSPLSTAGAGKKSHNSAIIGAVVAGGVVIAILCGALLLLRRKRRRQKSSDSQPTVNMSSAMDGPPMSSLPGSPAVIPHGRHVTTQSNLEPGKLDPRTSHALLLPHSLPAKVENDPHAGPYTSSSSSAPSSSERGQLSVVGSTVLSTEYTDSIADLKRQQQQVVNSYEPGHSSTHAPSSQHVHSGMRALAPAEEGPTDLPPVYTPQ
ncbi:hypothetical protein FB451DRAFT_1390294 [Mycena latifolia]|nr:hypothetical protein FB451DRAFT_1390294 [Mycena latifolia]